MAGLADILQGINSAFSDPSNAGTMGFAQGLLQAGAPHMMTPVTAGQALGMGMQGSQQYQSEALQNAMQRASVPFQQMKTASFLKALQTMNNPKASTQDRAAAKALMYSLVAGPGLGTAVYNSDPSVVAGKTKAETQNQFHALPPGSRGFGPAGDQSISAMGALPEGTSQAPIGTPGAPTLGSLNLSFMPGAPQAITANAANQAGGAAAAKLPYDLAASYHTRAPGAAGGTLGPRPGPFVPQGAAPTAATASPQVIAAAQAALRQRQMGMAQGGAAPPGAPPPPLTPTGLATSPNPQATLAANQQATARAAQAQQMARQRALAIQQAARQRAMGGQPQPNASPGPQGIPQVPQIGGTQAAAAGAPAPTGVGLSSPGLTPAQLAMSSGQGQQAVAMNAGYQKQAEDAKETLAQVAELRLAANDFTPGQFAESRIKGLQWMQSLGLITPKEAQQLGSAQEGTKMSIQLQSTLTRSLGSREAAQVFATLGRGVPNLTLSPDGFNKMTAYMEGMARYNTARAQRSQAAFNQGNVTGVNNVRNQYLMNSNPAYFIIASASPTTQREMVAQMGPNARAFLQRWAAATQAGYAPNPTAFATQP